MWPVALSGRLPVVALVSHYLTNKLIGREPIPNRKTFHTMPMRASVISSIRRRFQRLFQSQGQVAHVLLTRSPLIHPQQAGSFTVRLACVKHAASVRPEPGSNSPLMNKTPTHPQQAHESQSITQQGLKNLAETNNQRKIANHSLQPKEPNTHTPTPTQETRTQVTG